MNHEPHGGVLKTRHAILLAIGTWLATGCTGNITLSPTSTQTPTPSPTTSARNPLLQPFASDSIWNMPIGSGAVYTPANITPPSQIMQDEDIIILTPTAPMTSVFMNGAAWQSNVDRCDFTTWPLTAAGFSVPVPASFVLPNALPAGIGSLANNSGAILMPDGQTLKQFQPVQRCTAGGPVTFTNDNVPALYPDGNLYTDGIAGSHGGSGMSALGGSIRLGELIPGNSSIVTGVNDVMRHALKFEFNSGVFGAFGTGPFWPAVQADNGNEGLLIALLPTFSYNSLQTAPARSIAWTLINYGAYLVDDSGWDAVNICMELHANADGSISRVYDEFQSSWGYNFQQTDQSTPWAQDMRVILSNLQVITNNGANSVGGGGTPRQPLAAPLQQ